MVLAAMLLVVTPALAATKAPPKLCGVWKLDRDLTTAPYGKDDFVVVYQDPEQVKFEYRNRDDKVTGTDVFLTDGTEQKRYTSRLERTYYRAKWKDSELVI